MTEYCPRSDWVNAARGGAQLTGTKLKGVAFHWPGSTTDNYGVESKSKVAARLRGWRDYHLSRGWSDIGYNFAIDQAGRVWDLRGLVRVGAHCASPSNPDANHEYIGVLLILGDMESPSLAMRKAMYDFYYDVFLPRWPGRYDRRGHRQVAGASTECPGNRVLNLLPSVFIRDIHPEGADTMAISNEDKEWFRTAMDNRLKDYHHDLMVPSLKARVAETVIALLNNEAFIKQVRRGVWDSPVGGQKNLGVEPSYWNELMNAITECKE